LQVSGAPFPDLFSAFAFLSFFLSPPARGDVLQVVKRSGRGRILFSVFFPFWRVPLFRKVQFFLSSEDP